ncbi:uncharacterized protein TNIN_333021 [Trichonephila inaurata madagascariensis]|uniref:Uncharacterized protein n=1 Tax=Trichonephila inaurata madagascariensis TaxID=2747483 RepID=A0A8X7C3D2_9ARAC|nr:uncharacterized protein TNIN_333021 [Trichonephila inaurata madagascariensis]
MWKGSVPLLINADMNLSSEKLQNHLNKKEVILTAREYLDSLKNSKNIEEVVQATKVIPFIGSKREIEEAEQTLKPKRSLLELVKGAVNFMASNLTTAFFTNVSRLESQLPVKTDNEPQAYLNDPIMEKATTKIISDNFFLKLFNVIHRKAGDFSDNINRYTCSCPIRMPSCLPSCLPSSLASSRRCSQIAVSFCKSITLSS